MSKPRADQNREQKLDNIEVLTTFLAETIFIKVLKKQLAKDFQSWR